MIVRTGFALLLILAPGMSAAADKYTCRMVEKLLETADRGLADVAAGQGDRLPAIGIATMAGESLAMAEKHSTRDPLPEAVRDALTALDDAASGAVMMSGIAPLLLENGLIIQDAMPQICPETEAPDLARHGF